MTKSVKISRVQSSPFQLNRVGSSYLVELSRADLSKVELTRSKFRYVELTCVESRLFELIE